MMEDRPLRIEVLVNSPGPHDAVRIRQPFRALQKAGMDCRIHERPFRFNHCIRPHSLVIWQRPLPGGWKQQMEHLQWLRERGCLLLCEWDDHPELFPPQIRRQLENMAMAPLVGCHAVHSSSATLANALRQWNPLTLVFDNGVDSPPPIKLNKHFNTDLRVFIGNQNRHEEHQALLQALKAWAREEQRLTLVVVGDTQLSAALKGCCRCEDHPLLAYEDYRQLLSSCQIALLPLNPGLPQRCKTVIKWAEAAAESVAVVAGPELYTSVAKNQQGESTCQIATNASEIVAMARTLANQDQTRIKQVVAAHRWVQRDWNLEQMLGTRLALYQQLWHRRRQVDQRLSQRLSAGVSLLQQKPLLP